MSSMRYKGYIARCDSGDTIPNSKVNSGHVPGPPTIYYLLTTDYLGCGLVARVGDLQKNFLFFQRNFSDKTLIPFIGVWNYIGVGVNSVSVLRIGETW